MEGIKNLALYEKMRKTEKEKVTVIVDARILRLVKGILDDLGCPLNDAVNVYFYQIFYTQGIPFTLKLPPEGEWERFDICLKISEGLNDVEKGRIISGDQAFEKLRNRLDELISKKRLSEIPKE